MSRFAALLACVSFGLVAPMAAQAQETTLSVGTAGNITATNSLAGNTTTETISTAQIDGVLRVVAPGAFGQNFTRDRANKVFADFANFRTGLASSLAQTIARQSNIRRVNSVAINTSALNLRLSQKTNSVSGELGSIMARVSLVANTSGILADIFCPSVNVTFDLNDIKAAGDYNYISGDVSNASIAYNLTNVSASCNGFLGFIGNLFGPSGIAENQLRSAIQDQVNTQLTFVNMQRLFSLSDFANGLRYYGNESIISPLVNRAINVFRELVNDAAINTPGIVLNIGVEFATGVAGQNKISFIASHAPVDVVAFTPRLVAPYVTLNMPPNTERADVYIRGTTGNWRFLGSTTNGSLSGFPTITELPVTAIAIGRNAIIPGLESFPGVSVTRIQRDGGGNK